MRQLIIYPPNIDNLQDLNFIKKKIYTNLLIDIAAEGIFKTLDKNLQNKYPKDKISSLIKKSDKDKDGTITLEEAKKDIDNIFGLQLSDDAEKLKKVQQSVDKNLEFRHIKGLQLGLNNWAIAKDFVIQETMAQDLRNMFFNRDNVEYYCASIGKSPDTNKHLAELFKARGIAVDEIKKMGFSEKVLNDILRFYQD